MATYKIGGRTQAKSFAVKRYGEDQARALAIAARENFMRLNNDSFLAYEELAQHVADIHFGNLLQPQCSDHIAPLVILDAHTIDFRMHALDRWFDSLRPRRVNVTVANGCVPSALLCVSVSDCGWPARSKQKKVYLGVRTLAQGLEKAWSFLQTELTDMHDARCWQEFEAKYRDEFFSYEPARGFKVRYRYYDAEYALRCKPPASLAGLLPDFEVPASAGA